MLLNDDCTNFLPTVGKNTVDLVLVDPPYGISRKSMFGQLSERTTDEMAVKYGDISNDFGEWDRQAVDLDGLFSEYHRVLRPGGTLVIFYDVWKAGDVKSAAESAGFKQPRVCQWQKSNPVPINSKRNYLSNAVEFFFTFVKGKKPTFNSEYDSGVYRFPTVTPWESLGHPTQKPLSLIRAIVEKHSAEGDLVLDTFAGSGTTAHACVELGRRHVSVERDQGYYEIAKNRIQNAETKVLAPDIKK